MRKELRTERERQTQHEIMQIVRAWVDRFELDPTLLEIPLVRDFHTRRLLEQEALLTLLQQVDTKLTETAKPARTRKAA